MMKKKFFALVCVLIFVLCFTSCSVMLSKVGEIVEDIDTSTDEKKLTDEHSTDIDFQIPQLGKIHIKSYSIVDGFNDAKWLILKYDYTNLSEDNDCSVDVLRYLELYQDGASLNQITTVYDKDSETHIKPGASVEAIISLDLRNTTSDVEFELTYEEEVLSTYKLSIVSI